MTGENGMKRIISVILIFCTTLVFNSCALENEEAKSSDIEYTHTLTPEENNVDDTASSESTEQSPPPVNPIIEFTYAQALEDYDYFCELLDNSYPYSGVLERKYNITLDTIKKEFKEELEANKENMDLVVFAGILNNNVLKFNGLGHFSLLNYDMYLSHKAVNDETINEILDNNRTKEVYEYFYHEKLEPLNSWSSSNHNTKPSTSNTKFSLDVLDGNIAYMRIPSMNSGTALEAEGQKLKKFYSEITDCESLIIDITGNGGGSDSYWRLNIVAPNIKEKIEVKSYYFVRDYDLNREYIDGQLRNSGRQLKDFAVDINIIESFPQVNREDLELFDSIYAVSLNVSPIENDQIPYEGNIYLLIDDGVYSSAESFAMFCKKTGFATIIGKNSDGDGGGSNPFLTTLPNSGLIIRYTIQYVLNMDGSSNVEYGTTPDYACVGDETPLEACLRYIHESKTE